MNKIQCLLSVVYIAICGVVAADSDGEVRNREYKSYIRAGLGLPIYRHVSGGNFHPNPKFRISGHTAIGFKINPKFALELEGTHMKLPSVQPPYATTTGNWTSKMNYTIWAGFINGILNISNLTKHRFTPYLGLGVGIPLYSKQVFLHRKPITYKSLSIPGLISLEIESIIFCICLIMLLILRNFSLISQNISIIKCGQTFLTKKTGAFNIAYH